jgi:hypothetical protein
MADLTPEQQEVRRAQNREARARRRARLRAEAAASQAPAAESPRKAGRQMVLAIEAFALAFAVIVGGALLLVLASFLLNAAGFSN